MWVVGCCQCSSLLAIFPCLNEAFEEPVVCCSKRGAQNVPRVSRGSPGNQRKARVAAIVKIVEFPKENIGFQWSWWVPERPESGPPRTPEHAKSGLRGPDGLLEGPRGALGGSLETFRELLGSFRSTFCECFSTKKVIVCNFQSKRGRDVFSTRGHA